LRNVANYDFAKVSDQTQRENNICGN